MKERNLITKFYRCQMVGRKLILVFSVFLFLLITLSCEKKKEKLPWEREIPLKEAAKSVFLTSTLSPDNSLPNRKCYPRDGKAMTINNLKMRTTLWGPTEQITISLTKNNVWDRRINPRGLSAPTLQEIVDGVNSPANKGFIGRGNDGQRPWFYGYLLKDGGYYDPYRTPHEYAMPCLKPVGQIIVGIDQLKGAQLSEIKQCCANGLTELELTNEGTNAKLQYVLGMTSNMYAVRGRLSGIFRQKELSL